MYLRIFVFFSRRKIKLYFQKRHILNNLDININVTNIIYQRNRIGNKKSIDFPHPLTITFIRMRIYNIYDKTLIINKTSIDFTLFVLK